MDVRWAQRAGLQREGSHGDAHAVQGGPLLQRALVAVASSLQFLGLHQLLRSDTRSDVWSWDSAAAWQASL